MVDRKKVKVDIFSRPHDFRLSYFHDVSTGNKDTTIVPVAHYDEGLGAPSTYNAHREHASFAEYDGSNCFPDSRLDPIIGKVTFTMGKHLLETDKIHAIKCGIGVIAGAFEDFNAEDEVSTLDIKEIMELQQDGTNRETYPLWAGNKLTEKDSGKGTFNADMAGLTTTQVIEDVDFAYGTYYDALHYYTNGEKLRKVVPMMKQFVLTRQRPTRTFKVRISSKTKYMNPYAFMGVLTHVHTETNAEQLFSSADATTGNSVLVNHRYRFDEHNPYFDMERQ
jgi:hypothetical protein